jgi:hypothetical protein
MLMLPLLVLDALLKALLILGGRSRFLQRRHLALRMFVVHIYILVMKCGDNVSLFVFDAPVQNMPEHSWSDRAPSSMGPSCLAVTLVAAIRGLEIGDV